MARHFQIFTIENINFRVVIGDWRRELVEGIDVKEYFTHEM
jgi:hypothetical protein